LRGLVADVLAIVGAALVAWGLRMIYEPLAFLWLGAVLILAAVAVARLPKDSNGPTDNPA
jgi:hypothetical protein